MSSPELLPNKITKDEDNKQKPIRITSAGNAADTEQKDEDLFVRQHSSKPPVEPTPTVKIPQTK